MKKAFIAEGDTVHAGSEFTLGGKGQEPVGPRAAVLCLAETDAGQRRAQREGADRRPGGGRRGGAARPLGLVRSPFSQLLVSSSTPDLPGDPPWVSTPASAKADLKVKASGESKTHYGLALALDF